MSEVLIFDPDNIAARITGNFKGTDFVVFCKCREGDYNGAYWLKKDERGENCIVIYQGEIVAKIPLGIPCLARGVMSKIVKIEQKKKQSGHKIILPGLQNCGIGGYKTSLAQESRFLDSMVEWRLQSIRSIENNFNQGRAVLKILLSSSESGISISQDLLQGWLTVIDECVQNNQPITLSMSLAIGTRIPNRLKYFDDVNLPTFGWMYFFFFIKLLNEKVKLIYPPGIKVIIFDEAWLFGRFFGISQDIIQINLQAVQNIIDLMDVPVEIILMREEHFDLAEVEQIKPSVSMAQIYGFLCSLPDMNNQAVMHSLYRQREKNYRKIQMVAGNSWQEAREKCRRVAQYLTWRKRVDLFRRLINGSYIDATITDKDDRLVLDITCSLMNHGMPVVRRNDNGMLKVRIVPEYRISTEHKNALPVWIEKSDFDIESEGSFKYYYVEM